MADESDWLIPGENTNPTIPGDSFKCTIPPSAGYKGTDSYCSELDNLGNDMKNHVLSAEFHNQPVNSLALISARMTNETRTMEVLQMMITNILCALVQAIDLRLLQGHVFLELC